jgi:hypothetical protein
MGAIHPEPEFARDRADVVLELARVVTKLEAVRRLVPPHEREIAELRDRRVELLDELLELDSSRLAS